MHALVIFITDRKLFICDFNREQLWDRWLNKKDKGLLHIKNDVMCKLRRIARSQIIQESEEATNALKQSDTWKNNLKFSVYIKKYWLKSRRLSN